MHKVAIIILAGCILATASCTDDSKPKNNHGKITGSVLSATNGKPVGNASVKILHTGLRTETKYGGHYVIKYMPIGTYDIAVNKKGFRGDTIRNINVTNNAVSEAHFELIEGKFIIYSSLPFDADTDRGQAIGRVTDIITGEPIESARIHIYQDINKRVLSDSTGAYKLSAIRPGIYKIVARAENIGYWFVISEQINVEKGVQSVVDFELVSDPSLVSSYKVKNEISDECTSTGAIQGRVMDKTNGESIPFCQIQFFDSETKTITDMPGYFKFDSIPPGRYDISAKLMGYNAITAESVLVEIGKITTIEFKLSVEWIRID